MTAADDIKQIAIQIANDIQARALARKKELAEIETRTVQIKADLHAADLCHDRLARFQPEIVGDLQCPRCWVRNETRSSLTPTPGTDHEDLFKCRVCQFEFSIEA